MKMKNSVVLSFSFSSFSFSFLAFRDAAGVYMYINSVYFVYAWDLNRAATHRQNTGVGIDLNTILMV
jgi:hypothetical protein